MTTTAPHTFQAQASSHDDSPDQIESRAEFDQHIARGSLAGLTVQGLRFDLGKVGIELAGIDVTDTLFVGCRFPDQATAAELVRRGAHVVPAFTTVPYPTGPAALYTAAELTAGFAAGGFDEMLDTVVYRHFCAHGGPAPDVREALAQRIHDAAMDDALLDATRGWAAARGAANAVGIMGGHAERRGSHPYRLAATLAYQLAQAGRLVITGGGPGVMEAANLGAYLSQYPSGDLATAIDQLGAAPDFTDHDAYTYVALEVRRRYPESVADDRVARLGRGGLAIPTWLYGHEPTNLFAGGIAKYFSNAIREDTILRLSRGGVVFAPGRAGTVQEVFQAATKAFYLTDGASGPLVFLDREFWTTTTPVQSLLRPLLAASPHGDLSGLVHLTDDVSEAVAILTEA